MKASRSCLPLRRALSRARSYGAFAMALGLTLASNANAFTLPTLPLEIGAAYPPPNVMFILDISTSMERDYMPDDVPSVSPSNIGSQTYARNSIYYNPAVTYEAWMNYDGERMNPSPAVTYTAARGGTTTIGSSVNLSSDTQTYYVPKTAAANVEQTGSYYRYQIIENDSSYTNLRGRVVRAEWTARPTRNITTEEYSLFDRGNLSAARNTWVNGGTGSTAPTAYIDLPSAASLPANGAITELKFELSGDDADANLYVRRSNSSAVTTSSSYRCPSSDSDSNEVCTKTASADIAPGTRWYFGVRAADVNSSSAFSNVRLRITYTVTITPPYDALCPDSTSNPGWYNCTFATPTYQNEAGTTVSRSEAQEKQNFAMWYTYHRTRMKVAKAGASEAFQSLPSNLRIGYTDIRNSDNKFNIPVENEDGRFQNQNKRDWFDKLLGAGVNGYTPLRTGLISVGEYFKGTSGTGPWGPETGRRQLSCRQNFAILTTDGYWNRGHEANNSSAKSILDGATIGNSDLNAGTPYAGSHSVTLADIAMHYWKTDLRPDLANNVPASLSNTAQHQHMVTFGISLGLKGNIDPANVPRPGQAWTNPTTGWPNPIPAGTSGTSDAGAAAIDDLLHASINGRGRFVVANNAVEFQRGLLDAFSVVAQRTASSSGAASNSTQFTDDTRAFLAKFTSGIWSGELTGFAVAPGGVEERWTAASQITAATAAGTRKFLTWDGTAGATFPTSAQTTALDRSSDLLYPITGAQNVAYLKGSATLERRNGGILRDRESPLGDIVHSVPAYSADTGTVFIGANDGMMHAFDEATGAELFAYVPNIINFSELATYSSPNYAHSFFVDGPIVITSQAQAGGNYLVGALGHGGRGLYGLNVSDPEGFDDADVLWEISASSVPNIGNVLGTPLIATLQDDTKVVIVGNGPNSNSGNAVLLVINVASGAVLHQIDTGVGGDNGLFAPRGADFDADGRVDAVYAGDLRGNLWKFDFSSATPSVALGGEPLLTAQAGQSFTSDLALAVNPDTGDLWVFAGTGRYLANSDVADDTTQSVYAVIDNDTPLEDLDDLQEREITVVTTETDNGVVYTVRGFEPNDPLDTDKRGWYLNLDNPRGGERITTPLLIQQNVLSFLSRTPPFDEDPCNTGGSGWSNAIDAFTGSATSDPYFNVGDGFIDPAGGGDPSLPIGSLGLGKMPTGMFIIGDYMYISDTSGNFTIVPIIPPTGKPRRASWHEIFGN